MGQMVDVSKKTRNPLYTAIGKNIGGFRKELSLSQAKLANLIGMSQQHLASIEVGVRRIAIEDMIKICDVLHVTINELLPAKETTRKPGPRPKLSITCEKLAQLSEKDQSVVIAMIDSLANKSIPD
jgi:DNA-binding XRE family transcriptional regulator